MMESVSNRPSLLFLSNNFCAYGGSNCVLAWSLQALREDWDVTLFCSYQPDFESINRHFGTGLKAGDFKFKTLPFPLNLLDRIDPDPFSAQRLAWLMRLCRPIAHEYDVLMSCDDEFDFGRPGIQYTHFPYMGRHRQVFEEIDGLPDSARLRKFLAGKLRPWLLISGISLQRIRSNLMVTNSNWTADVLRQTYDVEPVVVYPPVVWNSPPVPWSERKARFACLGRLSPDKRLLELIGIIEKVRERGHPLGLDIIGDEDTTAGPAYVKSIRERIAMAGDWVRLHQSVSRAELEQRVSACRYGIHGMLEEHFGIAPAELVRAGCVVFVPNDGGQVEIVGEQHELRYDNDLDAVDKICRVLEDGETESRLRQTLAEQSRLFSEQRFMDNIRNTARNFYRNSK